MITLEQMALTTIYTGGQPFPRFPMSAEYVCPNCGGVAHEDNWPPNYWSMMGGLDGQMVSGSQKCVCLACAIQFTMVYYENSLTNLKRMLGDGGEEIVPQAPRKEWAANIHPLVEREGKYMTDIDVNADDYFKEHGEPLRLVYG